MSSDARPSPPLRDRAFAAAGFGSTAVLVTGPGYIGHAVRARADEISGAATVSLTTDYLAPAKPGAWLEAHVEIEKLGRRLAFADCSVTADGREVVRARAVFSVLD